MQCLLNPTEAFYRNGGGVSVILVRPKEIACGELREALEQYDRDPNATGQLCVVVCPQLEPLGLWTLDGPRWSKVLVLHAAELLETTPELFDAHSDAVAAVPYVDRLYESLSFVVMRAASYVSRRPFKVVVVDCDNTLWRGVVGEEGPGPLQPNLPLQLALKACAQRGLVLATCSKNIAADVEAAFAAHPEWPLAYSDFVVHKESTPRRLPHVACPTSPAPRRLPRAVYPTRRGYADPFAVAMLRHAGGRGSPRAPGPAYLA